MRGVRERRPLARLAGKGERQAPGSWGPAAGEAVDEWSAARSLGRTGKRFGERELLKLARE